MTKKDESELKNRIHEILQSEEGIAYKLMTLYSLVDAAKKELFASMPKQTKPNIDTDLDQKDIPLIVKISLEDWNAICTHWKILRKWLGESK